MFTALTLLACRTYFDEEPSDVEVPSETAPTAVPPDLTVRLAAGEVRAGVVTDEEALFGGVSSEGRAGDLKIYNDRVQFIIQAPRVGDYYLQTGGGVIDADIVRPVGVPGRDLVDEWIGMIGFGRLIIPETIEVLSDGQDGEAIIAVRGPVQSLPLLEGVLETSDFLPPLDGEAETLYRLRPDSWLLEVQTNVTANADIPSLSVGDMMMGAPEAADVWTEGSGLERSQDDRRATGYIDHNNSGAVAILAASGDTLRADAAAQLISRLADLSLGFQERVDIPAGSSRSFVRYYGVGPDMATLTDAVMPADSATATGTVTAPDGPVPGARVHVLVDGAPWTVAVSGNDGSFAARVPSGVVTTVAEGRSHGRFDDLPTGHAPWPAFAVEPVFDRVRESLTSGAPGYPLAIGRGLGSGSDGLSLGEPGRVVVEVDDALPFTVHVGLGAVRGDPRIAPARPGGFEAAGWSRGGPLTLELEPGTHSVIAHRGMRYEAMTTTVTVGAGETQTVSLSLPPAFEHPGYLAGDPHSHASPSGDGKITMEDRLLVQAAGGVQLHFGSDHDRVADYRPLVTTLGLDPLMRSVVADEVSSVIRGHMNAYPLVPDPEMPNHGALHWWDSIPESTDALVQDVRDRHGDIVVQANHPLDNGVASAAGWTPGNLADPSFFANHLDAIEVLNAGLHADNTLLYLDMLNRGYVVTPVGVSDSHGHFSSATGTNLTFIGMGDEVDTYTDAGLLEAFRARNTIASMGVFLQMSVAPGSVITEPTTLNVEARSPSWATVSRLELWVDGSLEETIQGTTATFELDAPNDTSFVVMAAGDSPMQPVSNSRPWALASAILLDRDGDGWDAPLNAL